MEALEAHNSEDSSPAAAEAVNFHSSYFCHNSGVYFNPHQLRLVSVGQPLPLNFAFIRETADETRELC